MRRHLSWLHSYFPSFNPRTPAGCDPLSIRQAPQPGKFQSTHPCGVRPDHAGLSYAHQGVSIHAPLRGATGSQIGLLSLHGCFNPRTPAGCDYWSWSSQTTSGVSIHAPLRGATDARVILNGDLLQFQSTHPCGVRLTEDLIDELIPLFQSTHPCGVRLRVVSVEVDPHMFQSTHPCGVRRGPWCSRRQYSLVSIHAPLRGATLLSRYAW